MNTPKLKIIRSPDAPARPGDQTTPAPATDDGIGIADWQPRRLERSSFPDQPSGNGALPSTIPNVRHLLEGNGVIAQYNIIKKKVEIVIPGLPGVLDNVDAVTMAQVKSLMALHGMYNGDARSIVEAIANENPHNPVADWIDSKPWDGRDRLPDFYATIVTVDDYPPSLKETLMYKWALGAAAAALMQHGFSARLVLTLSGPQSIGKTRWAMSLIPPPQLRASVLKTDHHFEGSDKDQIISAMRYWLVELGEVESSMRKDAERLKGIITRERDVFRVPYAATDTDWQRRTVFIATANGSDFLTDPSGSTRWGVIAVERVVYEHDIDMQQLWAQLAVDFRAEKQWWLDKAEEAQLASWNERHQSTSLVREAVEHLIDFAREDTIREERLSASQVLEMAGLEKPTPQQAREVGSIIRAKFGPPKKIRGTMYWTLPIKRPSEIKPVSTGSTVPATSKFD